MNRTQLLHKPDTSRGDLVLVNARHPLPARAQPDLAPLLCDPKGGTQLATTAARMLDFCLCACRANGRIQPTSGYRTRDEQREIWSDSLRENGEAFTRQYVALPGCSEHETGLAIDLARTDEPVDFIRPSLPNTGVYRHFREHAAEYGFVLRYPEDKTHITGIAYEPWHFRYVGWPHAVIMAAGHLVLEEYIDLLQGHTGRQNALVHRKAGRTVHIFRELAQNMAETADTLNREGALWQMSGDNTGGMVVTVWL